MSSEAVSGSKVIDAFNAMAGDPAIAMEAAKDYSTVASWTNWQAGQAASGGAILNSIPGVHLVGMVADIALVFHKMAYVCWGVGAMRGCVNLGKHDFANILGVWAGDITGTQISKLALSRKACEAAVAGAAGGAAVAGTGLLLTTATGQHLLLQGLTSGAGWIASQATANLAGALGPKIVTKVLAKTSGTVASSLSGKVATKAAAKIGPKLVAKGTAGWIPFLGAGVTFGINWYFVDSIATAADQYYSAAADKLDDWKLQAN